MFPYEFRCLGENLVSNVSWSYCVHGQGLRFCVDKGRGTITIKSNMNKQLKSNRLFHITDIYAAYKYKTGITRAHRFLTSCIHFPFYITMPLALIGKVLAVWLQGIRKWFMYHLSKSRQCDGLRSHSVGDGTGIGTDFSRICVLALFTNLLLDAMWLLGRDSSYYV